MYRKNEEQMEMLQVCEQMFDILCNEHDESKLDKMVFLCKCNFVCGFLYATFGESERFELLAASIKILIDTYQYGGGDNHETQ